jgi:hypothetical protein
VQIREIIVLHHPDLDIASIAATLEREGIYVLPEFLPTSEVTAIAEEGHRLATERPPFARFIGVQDPSERSFFVNVVPGRVQRENGWNHIPSYDRVRSMPLVKQIADQYLGPNWAISNVIYHLAAERLQELFHLHFDHFDGQKCFKVYIYLNAGNRTNGAFRYIPRSHRLGRAICNTPEKNLKAENSMTRALEVLDRYVDLSHETELRECCELLREIERDPEKSYDYVVAGGPGTVVLFDSVGIHGGGQLEQGERYIARYHFVDSRYVFRNLSDQLPPLKRTLSRAAGLYRRMQSRIAG